MILTRLWQVLFPPRCEHPNDGQSCRDYEGGGIVFMHYPTEGWRDPPPPAPRRLNDDDSD